MRQHVPATVRRWRHMRRTAIVLLSQTQIAADGSTRSAYEGVSLWRGGTGRYEKVVGTQREHSVVEYALDSQEARKSESWSDVEYWFEK